MSAIDTLVVNCIYLSFVRLLLAFRESSAKPSQSTVLMLKLHRVENTDPKQEIRTHMALVTRQEKLRAKSS